MAWTTRGLLDWTARHFEQKGLDAPRLSAEMLLAHVLGTPRLRLYMDPDRPASELERAAFRDLVERALAHEPVDYLVGASPFFSMMLKVTPATLIPRPSTETLVEHVLQHARRTPGFHRPAVADVGTGSGAIAVAVAKNLPRARVIATDISTDALDVARENAAAQGVADRIEFRHGHLLEPLGGQRVNYLLSNPPYIPDEEWGEVAPNVKDYEPTTALRGGPQGMDCLGPIIDGAAGHLDDPGQLVLEIASSRSALVQQRVRETGRFENVRVLPDHEKLPRVLVADMKD